MLAANGAYSHVYVYVYIPWLHEAIVQSTQHTIGIGILYHVHVRSCINVQWICHTFIYTGYKYYMYMSRGGKCLVTQFERDGGGGALNKASYPGPSQFYEKFTDILAHVLSVLYYVPGPPPCVGSGLGMRLVIIPNTMIAINFPLGLSSQPLSPRRGHTEGEIGTENWIPWVFLGR